MTSAAVLPLCVAAAMLAVAVAVRGLLAMLPRGLAVGLLALFVLPFLPLPPALRVAVGPFFTIVIVIYYAAFFSRSFSFLMDVAARPDLLAEMPWPKSLAWLLFFPWTTWHGPPRRLAPQGRWSVVALRTTEAITFGAGAAVVVLAVGRSDAAHRWPVVGLAAATIELYMIISAPVALWRAAWAATGYVTRAPFHRPFFASSLSEFWDRRWNCPVHDFYARHTFRPLARRMGARSALFAAFAASGTMHEYAFSWSVGGGWGCIFAFFALQGLATLAASRVARVLHLPPLPRPLAIALTIGFLLATSRLFWNDALMTVWSFDDWFTPRQGH